jgi:Domain of unknown function (DUF5069)
MMPRTIDKLRAKLPGGKIGAYSITTAFVPGLSLLLLDGIGVTEECLLEVVQAVSVEDEIADWLRRNADLSSVASLNEKLFKTFQPTRLRSVKVSAFLLCCHAWRINSRFRLSLRVASQKGEGSPPR